MAAVRRIAPEAESGEIRPEQQSLTALAYSPSARGLPWTAWALSAQWTGAVAASVTYSLDAVPGVGQVVDEFVRPGWREIVPLVERLGGYGPAHLTLAVRRAPEPTDGFIDGKFLAEGYRPQPPKPASLFAKLPVGDGTYIERWTQVAPPSNDVLGSLQRELERAGGRLSYEPESEPQGS